MAKTSQEIEREFISNLKSTTGKDLKNWLDVIKKRGIEKRNDIISWLKKDQKFGHMNASMLVGIYVNGGKPVYADAGDLLTAQFVKKENLRPLFDELAKEIQKAVAGTQITSKKTYISLHKQREFAAINIKADELRLGMDLGDMDFSDYLQKSKLTGPMPRISHMVTIKDKSDISSKFLGLLRKADQRVNG